MIKKVEGIIYSTVDYKESSKIVNIFTKEEGLIGTLAKGSKNIKNKLSATSNILTYGIFHLNYTKTNLPILIEVDIKDSLKAIRKNFNKTNYATFLLELSIGVFKHGKNKEIYPLLISALLKINDNFDERIITNIVELKYLDYLGIKPVINQCVVCGKKEDIITVSSYKGGYLCKNCVGSEYIFHLKTISLIRMFYYIDISKISKIDINNTIKNELDLFIDDYYERYSGLYLKSKELIQKFNKLNQE